MPRDTPPRSTYLAAMLRTRWKCFSLLLASICPSFMLPQMEDNDITKKNVQAYAGHATRGDFLYGAEAALFRQVIKPGMRVLEIGCGTGRVTRALAQMGAEVNACDLDREALKEVRAPVPSLPIITCFADARELPFSAGFFDVVAFAFNGLDFVYPEAERIKAIVEMHRVLKDCGWLIFSSHNPVGTLLSPRGVLRFCVWKCRVRHILKGCLWKSYAPEPSGLLLYHATPRTIIRQITSAGDFRFERCMNKTGRVHSRMLVTLFSTWPYYLFQKN